MEYKEFRQRFEDRLNNKNYRKEMNIKSFEFVLEDMFENWFMVEITDKFATYSITVEMLGEQCNGCMHSRIISTKYYEVDDLVIDESDEEIGYAEYEWEMNPDFEAVMDEIIFQAMDDGTVEAAFKEMYKLKNKIESSAYNIEVFENHPQILSTFLSKLSDYYE